VRQGNKTAWNSSLRVSDDLVFDDFYKRRRGRDVFREECIVKKEEETIMRDYVLSIWILGEYSDRGVTGESRKCLAILGFWSCKPPHFLNNKHIIQSFML
jgi:hypothetical protein